ncbi:MAG: ABC transporter substrate-binding protein [candidate division WOR-3 bacterium]
MFKKDKHLNPIPITKPFLFIALSFSLFVTGLLTCAPKEEAITIVYDAPPLNLDPHLRREIVTISILGNIYETLIAFDANMKMTPCLADYWENIDSLAMRFYLRPNVEFHNHKELTTRDVHYSLYRTIKLPESEYAYFRDYLDTILIEDSLKLVIKLKKPYALLLYDLSAVFIVPENFDPQTAPPCGTGAYYYFKNDSNGITLRYFQGYREKDIPIKVVRFSFVPQAQQRIALLKNNLADIITFIPLDMLQELKDAGRVIATEGVATRYLEMNLNRFPFNRKEFRQAINLALNRERLVREVYLGYATPANQFISQGLFGFDFALPSFTYNPDSARKIIKSLEPLPEIEFDFAQVREFIGRAITDDLTRVGLKIKVNPLPAENFWQKIESHSSDFYLIGSVPTSNEGVTTMKSSFHTHQPQTGLGMQNRTGYSNRKVDSLIEEMMRIPDLKRTTQLLIEAQGIILSDLPKIPIVWEKEIYGISRRIDWNPRLDEQIIVKEIKLR